MQIFYENVAVDPITNWFVDPWYKIGSSVYFNWCYRLTSNKRSTLKFTRSTIRKETTGSLNFTSEQYQCDSRFFLGTIGLVKVVYIRVLLCNDSGTRIVRSPSLVLLYTSYVFRE